MKAATADELVGLLGRQGDAELVAGATQSLSATPGADAGNHAG
ncbi:hypothetical protein [Candidatus Dormiibacter inghamiae]